MFTNKSFDPNSVVDIFMCNLNFVKWLKIVGQCQTKNYVKNIDCSLKHVIL